ncbi:MAG: matrixin family metalloprotease [Gemmatimonadetes bacterium]|nr:matrixin family metalloprotease [Gemmatimonadota bacterium]
MSPRFRVGRAAAVCAMLVSGGMAWTPGINAFALAATRWDDGRSAATPDAGYLDEILAARGNVNLRWPDRVDRPITFWMDVAHSARDERVAVINALGTWVATGIPVRFVSTTDSAHADVRIRFIDRFDREVSGHTEWTRDEGWRLTSATVTLARRHVGGEPLGAPEREALALHELGHLLGLDHVRDPRVIMAPKVRARTLGPADVATVRAAYALPPGPRR